MQKWAKQNYEKVHFCTVSTWFLRFRLKSRAIWQSVTTGPLEIVGQPEKDAFMIALVGNFLHGTFYEIKSQTRVLSISVIRNVSVKYGKILYFISDQVALFMAHAYAQLLMQWHGAMDRYILNFQARFFPFSTWCLRSAILHCAGVEQQNSRDKVIHKWHSETNK